MMNIKQICRLLPGIAILAGLMALAATPAQAACPIIKPVHPPATLNVDPTLPIGSVIGSVGMQIEATTGYCPELAILSGQTVTQVVQGEGIPNGNLYPTTIPGVAYRAKMSSGGNWTPFPPFNNVYWPVSAPIQWIMNAEGQDMGGGYFTLEFIKTGALSAGGRFGPQKVGSIYVNGTEYRQFYMDGTLVLAPETPSCTITQSTIDVSLPDGNQATLNAVGKTTGETSFIIPLQCKSDVSLSLFFSGEMADSANAVFQNTQSSNATAVGIQILRGGAPIPIGSGNAIKIGTVGSSGANPSFTARYYALQSSVPSGDVNAVAYATIVYN